MGQTQDLITTRYALRSYKLLFIILTRDVVIIICSYTYALMITFLIMLLELVLCF